MDISTFLVPNCPRTVIYIPNFITSQEETSLLAAVQSAPKPKWEQLSNRRLLNYGGVPHANGMIAEPLPGWLQTYVDRVNSLGVFDKHLANHVLINEYLPGQGIMAHTDGPLFHPVICTISCGSHTVLELMESPAAATVPDDTVTADASPRDFKLLVERRSLLILQDDVYHRYLHAIAEQRVDRIADDMLNLQHCCDERPFGETIERERRVSLTIRNVPKTTKFKLQLSGILRK